MKKLVALGLAVLLTACGGEVEEVVEEAGIAQQLLVLETDDSTIKADDPRVIALTTKLQELSDKTGLTERQIGNMAYKAKGAIAEQNKPTNMDEVLEVVATGLNNDKCVETNEPKTCVSEYLAMYATVRLETEQTHEETLSGFKAILDFANDPEKMAELDKLANSEIKQ